MDLHCHVAGFFLLFVSGDYPNLCDHATDAWAVQEGIVVRLDRNVKMKIIKDIKLY
jgi:hypothetical protein